MIDLDLVDILDHVIYIIYQGQLCIYNKELRRTAKSIFMSTQ